MKYGQNRDTEISDNVQYYQEGDDNTIESTNSVLEENLSTSGRGKLLYTTKGKLKKSTGLIILSIALILIMVIGFTLDNIIAWIFLILCGLSIINPTLRALAEAGSYVNVYENIIEGVAIPEKKIKSPKDLITFSLPYNEVTHLKSVGNTNLIIHTENRRYIVQANTVVSKVYDLINNKINGAK